jgi:hypothetical protein
MVVVGNYKGVLVNVQNSEHLLMLTITACVLSVNSYNLCGVTCDLWPGDLWLVTWSLMVVVGNYKEVLVNVQNSEHLLMFTITACVLSVNYYDLYWL